MAKHAKQTEKLKKAELLVREVLAPAGHTPPTVIPTLADEQEQLYSWLNNQDYFWDTDSKQWEFVVKSALPYGAKGQPNMVFHLRLIAHPDILPQLTSRLLLLIEANSLISGQPAFKASNQSKPYPDREDTGERVYMEFRP